AANLNETTFSDIFKGDILILLCSNIGATHVPEQIAFSALSVLLKPSSDQRSNNGTKSIPGSLWFDLDLQTALSGVHEYGGLCHRSFVNGNRHPLLLREGADSANMIAGQSFSIGSHHHLCRLAVKCAGQLFHADFTIRWDDNTNRLAVDLSHKRFQDASRLCADGGSSLKADAFPVGIVVVPVEGKIYASLVQRKSSACALRHDDMVPVPFHSLPQACAQLNLRSRQRLGHRTVLFGVQRVFLKCRVVNARNVSVGLQIDLCDGEAFPDLFQFHFGAGVYTPRR